MSELLAVGMTTAPRRQQYPLESLQSFRDAGFEHTLHVFAEPESHNLGKFVDVEVHWNEDRLGCYRNWKHALTWLVANVPAKWYLLVQDDVVYRDDTWHQLEKGLTNPELQNVGFLSPYASAAMVSKASRHRKGWQPAAHGPRRGFWGALTFCMPAKSAKRLLNNERFQTHQHHRKVDVLVGNCFRDMGLDRRVCVPSLCDHIGKVSTLGRHKIRGISHGRRGFRFRPKA